MVQTKAGETLFRLFQEGKIRWEQMSEAERRVVHQKVLDQELARIRRDRQRTDAA